MQANEPYLPFGSWLKNFKNSIRNNFKEFSNWLGDVFVRQNRDVIEVSAKTFRWHFKEVMLCVLLAFLFAKVDKVQHFFTSFSIDIKENTYTLGEFLFAFCTNGLMVLWLSYVFWHKPKRVRGWINHLFGDRRDRSYDVHFNLPNGLWWVAVVSTLPAVLVNIALSISLLKDYNYKGSAEEAAASDFVSNYTILIFFGASFLYLAICLFAKPRTRDNISLKRLVRRFWQRLGIFILVLIAFCLLFYYFPWNQPVDLFWRKTMLFRYLMLGGFIYIPTILLTHVWYTASMCLNKEEKIADADPEKEKKRSRKMDLYFDTIRYFSYGLSICFFGMLNQKFFTTDEWFSRIAGPVAVLLFVFIFYYQLWDFVLHNVTRIRRNTAFVLLLLSLGLAARKEHFQLKFNGITPATVLERADMETFFLKWAYDRFERDGLAAQDSAVFYLVAAEGGGSRSGAWTSSVLTELDARSQGRFRRNCFAISSVSGGTVGAAVTLALWDNVIRDSKFKEAAADSLYKCALEDKGRCYRTDAAYIQRIFGRNYISTAIAGIFFYDFWQSVPLINLFYTSNYSRTDRHQDEENDAVSKALSGMLGNKENDYKTYFKHTSFLRLYYSQSEREPLPRASVDLPLFFPNTTRVEDGRRGILSAVQMPAGDTTYELNPFVSAVDVIGLAARENRFRSISLSEAAGLSQLFPYVNSNVNVSDNAGRFMDGGAYENMGLTTMYEIRRYLSGICSDNCNPRDPQKLKKTIQANDSTLTVFNNYLSRIQFKMVLIYNVDDHLHEESLEKKASRQWLDPVTTLLKTPFSGHTDHIYHKVKREFKSDIIEFALIDKNNTAEYHQDIVMSRWLSKYEMKYILNRSETLTDEKFHLLRFKPVYTALNTE